MLIKKEYLEPSKGLREGWVVLSGTKYVEKGRLGKHQDSELSQQFILMEKQRKKKTSKHTKKSHKKPQKPNPKNAQKKTAKANTPH